jgi:isopentenyl diphosphate isomerase/L-lactate dehydrogenase-like FMN-dependent dehydrogenase
MVWEEVTMIGRVNFNRVANVEDVRALAARRLPRAVMDSIDGGAGDELTVRENRAAFDRIMFRPRALAELESCDTATTVLGTKVSMPLLLGPTGYARMAHSAAESAVARAAGRAETVFVLSAGSSEPLEDVARAATGPLWFQYYPTDRESGAAQLDRVQAAGFETLCVTIDSSVNTKRDRDVRNQFGIPLPLTPRLMLTGLSRPLWLRDFLLGRVGRGDRIGAFAAYEGYRALANVVKHQRAFGWDDLEWLRSRWPAKLVIKGIQRGDECARLLDYGVDGFIVSNHGGRYLDGTRATIDVLPEVVGAVNGRAEVLMDGGVRRGADVVKALALGARACLVGRPYVWGLGAAGEKGVDFVLAFFQSEIHRTMALLGCSDVNAIDTDLIAFGEQVPSTRLSL